MAQAKKPEKDNKCEKHNYMVTESQLSGGRDKATVVRCSHCLVAVDLEQLESKEWQAANGI